MAFMNHKYLRSNKPLSNEDGRVLDQITYTLQNSPKYIPLCIEACDRFYMGCTCHLCKTVEDYGAAYYPRVQMCEKL